MDVTVDFITIGAKLIERHCKTCISRVRGEDTSWGGCSSPKFNRTGDVSTDTDGVELGCWALFGEDFGCVHWAEKQD
jgi:hypothetical protein